MSVRYRISQHAILDLDEIFVYTLKHWSVEQADKYYKAIISEIKHVTKHFESGRLISQVREGYRSSKINSHIIFYRKGQDSVIEIVRILHESMDWKRHLE